MNETTYSHCRQLLLAAALMLLLAGCGGLAPAATPTFTATVTAAAPLPTPTWPPFRYLHYTPSPELQVYLEFDYPDYWYISEGRSQYTDYVTVFMADPGILAVPTRAPGEPHGTPSDIPYIAIDIQPLKPGETLEARVQEQKQIDETSRSITPLADYPLEIDSYAAYALDTRVDIPEVYGVPMFYRRMFFIAYDQFYLMDFVINEQYRGDRFEHGYAHFLQSLKVVP